MTVARTIQLAEVAELDLGKSPPASTVVPAGSGTSLVARPSELGSRRPEPEAATTLPLRLARTDDLIMSVRGANFGRVNIADEDYAVGRGLAIIRPHTTADAEFLFYALSAVRPQLQALASGTPVPSLALDQLATIPVPWPISAERGAIAAQLRTVEEFASQTRTYAEAVSASGEALYEVLVAPQPDESLQPGWSRVALGDLVEEVRGRFDPGDLAGTQIAHYSYEAARTGVPETISGDTIGSPKKRVPDGALLLSLLEPTRWIVGHALPHHDEMAVTSPEFLVAVPRDRHAAAYIYAAARFDQSFRRHVIGAAYGTGPGRERTKPKDALRAELPLPPEPELYTLSAQFNRCGELEAAARRRALAAADLLDSSAEQLMMVAARSAA